MKERKQKTQSEVVIKEGKGQTKEKRRMDKKHIKCKKSEEVKERSKEKVRGEKERKHKLVSIEKEQMKEEVREERKEEKERGSCLVVCLGFTAYQPLWVI